MQEKGKIRENRIDERDKDTTTLSNKEKKWEKNESRRVGFVVLRVYCLNDEMKQENQMKERKETHRLV